MNPDRSPVTTAAPLTSSCPFCRSADVLTTGKLATDDSYWRCRTCGQIWNPRRLVNQRPKTRW